MDTILEARDLKKDYEDRTVLDIESMEVRRGEVLAVLGPSGAGKSVLLRLLNLLEQPTGGTVVFDGEAVQDLKGVQRIKAARRMALIFQDPLLFRGTVGWNVAYGLRARRLSDEQITERVASVLRTVKLEGLEDHDARTLSGGEAQRASLARALVLAPELLFLDEPFANLDPLIRRGLLEDVKEIFEESGISAVFVTHDQEEAARIGHRIAVLDHGRIVQEGSPRSIFYHPETEFVARFVGVDNIWRGTVRESTEGLSSIEVEGRPVEVVADLRPGEDVTIGLRPEDVVLVSSLSASSPSSSRNSFEGRVIDIEMRGAAARVTLECPFELVSLVTRRSLEEMDLEVGSVVGAAFKATAVHPIHAALEDA